MKEDRKLNHKIGQLGEQLVSQWLEQRGWITLHHRWYSCWGEIDVIAQEPTSHTLAFVEIKTRSRGNWDADGILAINAKKQTHLCQAASLFLSEYPSFAEFFCRFDVALVGYLKKSDRSTNELISNIKNQSIVLEGYQLTLHNYIESAFSCF